MDSEHAIWAAKWLQDHANIDAFSQGWTYILEAVRGDRSVVMWYMFEGLVLVGAVSPRGVTLTASDTRELGTRLGVMSVPYLEGKLTDLAANLPLTATATTGNDHDRPGKKRAYFKGWVLSDAVTSRPQYKLLSDAYTRSSRAILTLHPQVVWKRVRDGALRASLLKCMPLHFGAEMDAVLCALLRQFRDVRTWVQSTCKAIRPRTEASATVGGGVPVAQASDIGAQESRPVTGGGASATGGSDDPFARAFAVVQARLKISRLGIIQGSGSERGPFGTPAASQSQDLDKSSVTAEQLEKRDAACMAAAVDFVRSRIGATAEALSDEDETLQAAALPLCACLKYALDKKDAVVAAVPMYYTSNSSSSRQVPSLRGLILDCIQPKHDGTLAGYKPSDGLVQTFSTGDSDSSTNIWSEGPAGSERHKTYSDSPVHVFEESILQDVLVAAGDMKVDMRMVACVCKHWNGLVTRTPHLRGLSERKRSQEVSTRRLMQTIYAHSAGHIVTQHTYAIRGLWFGLRVV